MKKFPRKYRYGAGIFVILIGLMIGCILYTTHKNTYAKVVGNCENKSLVDYWEQFGESYAIGVNAEGYPIFRDMDAAFEQAQIDWAEGFAYLYQYTDAPKFSKKRKVLKKYKLNAFLQTSVPMTVENYEEIERQCRIIAKFAGIYLDSYGEY